MILCTGAKGMCGSYISWPDTIKTDIGDLDVTDKKAVNAVRYSYPKLSAIVHLAAETDLEYCETHPSEAFDVNTIGTYNMLTLARNADIPFVYISTAGIFDGGKYDSYTEIDVVNPLNIYGTSKWMGEIITKTYPKHYIFRASWMMGGGPIKDKKFVGKIMKKIRAGEKLLYGITDMIGSPTYAFDLVENIRRALLLKIPYGTYNCAGDGIASRYQVAKAIIEITRSDVKLEPVTADFFNITDNVHTCRRSHNEMLDMTKLGNVGLWTRHWKDALTEYLEMWK
jgi:dTDP-4-dehydrorhamnose reductase|tara:strand:+ start:120 stop:968 length:849 start_codon:yes stop_codon:yes gene_type:complete